MVGPGGEQVGIVRVQDALRLARESDLDLVEVAPNAKPPVAKLMDFGKYKYEAAVKAREARKNQANTVLKEVRFRLKIDTHDYETKVGHAKRFLSAGDKVKAMIQFRGREQQRPAMGVRLLERLAEDVAEVGVVETAPRVDGRNMVMVIGPLKNKAEARAEARKQKQRETSQSENQRKQRVDTSNAESVTQSIGDAFPAELRQAATVQAESSQSAPIAAEDKVQETVAPASGTEATQAPAQPEASAQQATADAKVAAAKPAAAQAGTASASSPKPAASPKPAGSAKPGAKPAPAKPSAAAKPAAPKPGAFKPGPAKK
ncbi:MULTISPECIES: translation initiation factor IF-3 [Kocuria]|uniref:translation initiation factor IF-3 n=1 Tax=Kocuria TaxID=57493 RepID=UPI001F603F9F|nr:MULTISPECIES: translation initiation factor IF-3 [Kocuria]MDT0118485.1 translation initiation factor IF-3 [Kocuria sp. PD6]